MRVLDKSGSAANFDNKLQTMKKAAFFSYVFVVIALCGGCRKNDNPTPDGGKGSWGSGRIYYSSPTEGVRYIDLSTKTKGLLLPENYDRHDWDVSVDGQKVITSANTGDTDWDANLITITKASDGQVTGQFRYYPTEGDYASPRFSPDGSKIGIVPTYHDGIVVMNLDGHVEDHLLTFAGTKISQNIMAWMPDKSLLFMVGNKLCRTNTAYTSANVITEISLSKWGAPQPSPDGTRIAYASGNHIWIMNADGSNKKQVTQSTDEETYPVFSPDGKYLLIGTRFIESTGSPGSGVFSDGVWAMTIIPADGQQYNVDQGADDRVIQLKLQGKDRNEICNGTMIWR